MKRSGAVKIASAIALYCVAAVAASHAQTFSTIFSFSSSTGSNANALVQGTDGNFYGTSELYGTNMGGTVYEIMPGGKLTTIYSFCSLANCADGANPNAGLLLAGNGNFYGTTNGGGVNGDGGTVFTFGPAGQLTTLYSFCSQAKCADGGGPSVLVQGRDGNLYGITGAGGTGHQCFAASSGCGTVFEITAKGVLTTLHSFCIEKSCLDGAEPLSLVLGTDGNFYGTTFEGGSGNCFDGCGTFFRMNPAGKLTLAYSFASADGDVPNGVAEGSDGNFYGTARVGGGNGNGTVFQITPSGEPTVLYSFCAPSSCSGGAVPWSGVVQGSDGNFYGTTSDGGTGHCPDDLGGLPCGTIFQITPAGDFTSLYSFCPKSSGCTGGVPVAALIQGTDGAFYGTGAEGGSSSCSNGCGNAFRFSTGLAPFVSSNPVFGKFGYTIQILGNDLTGATSVTFNGVPATSFTVVSPTFIRATVPAGATTGTIEVTTPSGTLSSNVAFQVLP